MQKVENMEGLRDSYFILGFLQYVMRKRVIVMIYIKNMKGVYSS